MVSILVVGIVVSVAAVVVTVCLVDVVYNRNAQVSRLLAENLELYTRNKRLRNKLRALDENIAQAYRTSKKDE